MAHTQFSGGDARPADHTQGYMRAGLLLRRCARLYTQQMTAVFVELKIHWDALSHFRGSCVLNGFNGWFLVLM